MSKIPTRLGNKTKEDPVKTKKLAIITSSLLQELQHYENVEQSYSELKDSFNELMSIADSAEETMNNICIQHLNEFETESSKFGEKITSIISTIFESVSKNEEDIDRLTNYIPKLLSLTEKYKNRISQLEAQISSLQISSSNNVNDSLLNDANNKIIELTAQNSSLKQQLQSKDTELSNYKQIQMQNTTEKSTFQLQISKYESEINNLRLQLAKEQEEKNNQSNNLNFILNEKEDSQKQINDLNLTLSLLKTERDTAINQLSEAQSKIVSIQSEFSQYKLQNEAKLAVNEKNSVEMQSLIKSLTEERDEARKELKNKDDFNNILSKERENLIKAAHDKDLLIQTMTNEKTALHKVIEEKSSEFSKISIQSTTVMSQLTEKSNMIDQLTKEKDQTIETLKDQINELENQIINANNSHNEEVQRLKAEKEAANSLITEKMKIINELKEDQKQSSIKITELSTDKITLISQISDKDKQISTLTQQSGQNTELIQQLNKARTERDDAIQQLSDQMKENNKLEIKISDLELKIESLNKDSETNISSVQFSFTSRINDLSNKIRELEEEKTKFEKTIKEKDLLAAKLTTERDNAIKQMNENSSSIISSVAKEKESLNSIISQLRQEKTELMTKLNEKIEEKETKSFIQQQLSEQILFVHKLTEEKDTINKKLEILTESKSSVEKQLSEQLILVHKLTEEKESINKKYQELNNSQIGLTIEKESLVKQLHEKYQEVQKLTIENDEKYQEIQKLTKEKSEIQNIYNQLNSSKEDQKSIEFQQLKLKISDLESLNSKLREDNNNFKENNQKISSEISELMIENKKLTIENNQLLKDFKDVDQKKKEFETNYLEIKTKFEFLSKENERITKDNEKLDGQSQDISKIKQELDKVRTELGVKSSSLIDSLNKNNELLKQNNLLVSRFKESETKNRELEMKANDIKNSMTLTISTLQGKIDEYEEDKSTKEELLKHMKLIVDERDELQHYLDEAREQITELTIKAAKSEREFLLEQENKDLRDRLASTDIMLNTYTQLNTILDGRVKQQNEQISRLPSAPSTPVVKKTSIGVSPLKSAEKENDDVSLNVIGQRDYSQEISILQSSLNISRKEISRLQDELSLSKMNNIYPKIERKKIKIQKLKKEIEELKKKIDQLQAENIIGSEENKKLRMLSSQYSAGEMRARAELSKLEIQLSSMIKQMKISGMNPLFIPSVDISNDSVNKELVERFMSRITERMDKVETEMFQKIVKLESIIRSMLIRIDNFSNTKTQRISIYNRKAMTPTKLKSNRLYFEADSIPDARIYT